MGLPFVPGKHLKGLLRDAWQTAEDLDFFKALSITAPEKSTELVFGTLSQQDSRHSKLSGILVVENAVLTELDRQFLSGKDENCIELCTSMFSTLQNTSINSNGVALNGSLRAMEVPIAMSLESELALQLEPTHDDRYPAQQKLAANTTLLSQMIDVVVPLITHIGAHRTRGLGEVQVSVASKFVGAQQ